jgi:hypothetical protein
MTNEEKLQQILDLMKYVLIDHENRAYLEFNPEYFISGEMRDVGVVVDRELEEIKLILEKYLIVNPLPKEKKR